MDGQRCYPTLQHLPVSLDVVDVFRRPDDLVKYPLVQIGISEKLFRGDIIENT